MVELHGGQQLSAGKHVHKCMNVTLSSGWKKKESVRCSAKPSRRSKKYLMKARSPSGAREPGSPSDAGGGEEEEGGGGEETAG